MTTVVLRPAAAVDIPAVLDFWKAAAENTDRADSAPALERLLERDPEALMLAAEDGRIVGTLIAGWDGWRCHLYRFAVAPDRRRRGIGRMLLDAAEQRFAGHGAERVDAMVLADNTVAQPAWAAAGYAPQPEWVRWVKKIHRSSAAEGRP